MRAATALALALVYAGSAVSADRPIEVGGTGMAKAWDLSVETILTSSVDVEGLVLAAPAEKLSFDTLHRTTQALDYAGCHAEAEARLRVLWDAPLPAQLNEWAQTTDGEWQGDGPRSQGMALTALSRHYLITRDEAWLAAAYPSIERGCAWLRQTLQANDGLMPGTDIYDHPLPDSDPNQWATRGLEGGAELADALGQDADASAMREAAQWIVLSRAGLPWALYSPELGDLRDRRDPSSGADRVPFDHWAYDAVQKLVDEGIIIGYPKTHEFKGDRAMTRYEFAMALSRLALEWPGLPDAFAAEATGTGQTETGSIVIRLLREFLPEVVAITEQIDDLVTDRYEVERIDEFVATQEGEDYVPNTVGRLITSTFRAGGGFGPAEACEFIIELRECLVRDDDGGLTLFPISPHVWLRHEAEIKLTELPTRYGPLSCTAQFTHFGTGYGTLIIHLAAGSGERSIRIRQPYNSAGSRRAGIEIDGGAVKHVSTDSHFVALAQDQEDVTVSITYEPAPPPN